MDIHLHIDRDRSHLVLRLTGDLDIATADTLAEAIHAFRAPDFARVTLDLSRLRFCDCAGLNAFITAHEAVSGAGGHLHLAHPPPAVRRLLTITGCDWLLHQTPVPITQTV